MKRILFSTVLLFACISMQAQFVAQLSFSAKDLAGHYIDLDSVEVSNLTLGWHEMLYASDLVLAMPVSPVGIGENPSENIVQSQYPNPFDGTTNVDLRLDDDSPVTLKLTDMNGVVVARFDKSMKRETPKFRISVTQPGVYILTVMQNGKTSSMKLVNVGGSGKTQIEYVGEGRGQNMPKYTTNKPFNWGNRMRFVGYATVNGQSAVSHAVVAEVWGWENVCLYFDEVEENVSDGAPCADAPTMTDADGNVYATIRIGNQCWMKENLRTTRYPDNTSIAMGMEPATSTAVGLRYAPNGDTALIPQYGYLYNAKAARYGYNHTDIMDYAHIQGICPAGWHLPSNLEWEELQNYVSGIPDYACGGIPTDVAKALADSVGWTYSPIVCAIGNDLTSNNILGFGALPAGGYYGYFENFGIYSNYWSSTYISNGYISLMFFSYELPYPKSFDNYDYGAFSVRCLKD